MAETCPFGFRGECFAEIEGLWRHPFPGALPAGRVMDNNFLQASPNHLRETHFVLGGYPFGLPVEGVRDLHLRLNHNGNLP
jgi:hypothetical protein